jgi:hypothetical protein
MPIPFSPVKTSHARAATSYAPVRLMASTAAIAALAACSAPKPTEFAPSCPRVVVVADAADLSRYRPGGGQDLTDLVLDGRILPPKGSCEREDRDNVRTNLNVDLQLLRGPASRGRAAPISYFVAVRDGDRLIDKQVYNLTVTFPENQDQMRITGPLTSMLLPVNKEKAAAAYDVLVGFQLSPDELAVNRQRGPR